MTVRLSFCAEVYVSLECCMASKIHQITMNSCFSDKWIKWKQKKEKCQKKKSLFINCILLDKEDIIWHSYYSLHDNETKVNLWYKWQLCPTWGSTLKNKSLLVEINCKSLYVFGTLGDSSSKLALRMCFECDHSLILFVCESIPIKWCGCFLFMLSQDSCNVSSANTSSFTVKKLPNQAFNLIIQKFCIY